MESSRANVFGQRRKKGKIVKLHRELSHPANRRHARNRLDSRLLRCPENEAIMTAR